MQCETCGHPIGENQSSCGVCQAPVRTRNAAAGDPWQARAPQYDHQYAHQPYAQPYQNQQYDNDRHGPQYQQQYGPQYAPQSAAPPRDLGPATGRPPRFSSAPAWIMAGVLRNPRGVLSALLTCWTGVPVALLTGALCAGLGALSGALDKSEIIREIPVAGPTINDVMQSAFDTGGPVAGALAGGLVGAVLGVLLGWATPWIVLAEDSPVKLFAGVLGVFVAAAIIAVAYTLFEMACEPFLLRSKGARPMSRREAALITPIIAECARALRILSPPPVLIGVGETGAYAGIRHIVLGAGLLDEFDHDPEVLAAILSHELTHWNNADPVAAAFARGAALPLYLLYTAATAIIRALRGDPMVTFTVWSATWAVLFPVRFLIISAQAADARAAEYLADAGAVAAGHRAGMRTCLARRTGSTDGGRSGWERAIRALHPPNELRLEELEEPGADYPLPDPEAPARPLPVAVAE